MGVEHEKQGIPRTLFDENTILKADVNDEPEALTIAEQRLVGRITSGEITALTAAQVKTLLAILGTDVGVSELSPATYDDVQDYINLFGQRTQITGMDISDNGDGTIAVSLGTGWCKVSNSVTAEGKFFDFAGDNSVAVTDQLVNYVYLDYNGGTPQIVVDTTFALAYDYDHMILGCCFRDGTTVHIFNADEPGLDSAHKSKMRAFELYSTLRASGAITSSIGIRQLAITAGVFWLGNCRKTSAAFNTSVADTFSYWYTTDSGATWTEVVTQNAISNTQYNDITSGLVNLTVNRYGVHWLCIDHECNHLHVLYGQGDYTASQAEEAAIPSVLPPIVSNFGVLLAKIICQEGTNTLTISYPWTTIFRTSLATDHGNLTGLLDDDHTQYLLADGTRALAGAWDMGSQALTNVNIDSGTIDGVTMATSDITVGAGKTLNVSAGTLTLADNQISGDKVEGGTIAAITITALTLGATLLTVTGAELNLLDLAGLTAGEVLVATGAATAAWQSTGVVLSAPDISGAVTAAAALTMPTHALSGALDANSNDINNVAAPDAAGDPLIKGTRVTTAELPAMTDEKIWKGTGGNVEEVDVYTDAMAVSAIEAAGLTFAENKGVILDAVLSADGKWSGITEAGTAGAELNVGDIVYLASTGKWLLAKADVAATSKDKLGMVVLYASGDAQATNVLLYGKIRAATLPALTVGAPVHISATTAGDVVVAAPTGTTNFVVRIIGYGATAEDLFFCPDNTYLELA